MRTTTEILTEALRVFRRRGMTVGMFVDDETGAVCTTGAINCAVVGIPSSLDQNWPLGARKLRNDALLVLGQILVEQYPDHPMWWAVDERSAHAPAETLEGTRAIVAVPLFNDYPHTTFEMVEALFEKGILASSEVME